MSPRIGQQFGNYQLIRLLGQGGFADVYLGEHIYLKSHAAIKVLHTQLVQEDSKNFLAEARTLVRLVHPHIVRVLDFGLENGAPFLVMDYALHGTLRQRHTRGAQVTLPIIVTYVKQIASALQYAHDQKLIHRDVKPENMLLGRGNEVLLSDFGIAVVAHTSHHQTIVDAAGTIGYMAPEQVQGHPCPASDQYALAISVYEWLCGEQPFQGSFTEIAAQLMTIPPPPLREKLPALASAFEKAVMKALAKDFRDRYPVVLEFAEALEQAILSNQSASFIPSDESMRAIDIALSPHLHVDKDQAGTQSCSKGVSEGAKESATLQHTVSAFSSLPGGQMINITGVMPVLSGVSKRSRHKHLAHFANITVLTVVLLAFFLGAFAFVGQWSHMVSTSSVTRTLSSKRTVPTMNSMFTKKTADSTPTTVATTIVATSTTATPQTYSNIAGYYAGTIHNTYAQIPSSMTLRVNQNQSNISGYFMVAQPLLGNGTFVGSIEGSGSLRFLVHSRDTSAPILFSGQVQPDTSLQGSYCSVNPNEQCDTQYGGYGTWSVSPTTGTTQQPTPGVGIHVGETWTGSYVCSDNACPKDTVTLRVGFVGTGQNRSQFEGGLDDVALSYVDKIYGTVGNNLSAFSSADQNLLHSLMTNAGVSTSRLYMEFNNIRNDGKEFHWVAIENSQEELYGYSSDDPLSGIILKLEKVS